MLTTRASVSSALGKEGIARFRELLASFRARYPRGEGDIARFEFLLDEMFDVFVSCNLETGLSGQIIDCFPPQDNFDTGNAGFAPFPPFVEGVCKAFCDLDAYRAYFGPRPIPGLEDAVKAWLVRNDFVSAVAATELAVAVGVGTVNLYDSLCRMLIERPGDIVIIPDITYGYFIPQIERNGGQCHLLRTHEQTRKVTAQEIESHVRRLNEQMTTIWHRSASHRVNLYFSEISSQLPDMRLLSSDELRSVLNEVVRCNSPEAIQSCIEDTVQSQAFKQHSPALSRVIRTKRVMALLPPRVVAYVHINPTLFGEVYEEAETIALTRSMEELRVTIIEDISYHSIGRYLRSFKSCLYSGNRNFALLGVSKPLAIANCRLGLLVANRRSVTPLYRVIENSVGFVSTLLQQGLLSAFNAPEALDEYLQLNWTSRDRGYRLRQNVLFACIEGRASGILNSDIVTHVVEVVRNAAEDFFLWKEQQGILLFDPEYRFRNGRYAQNPLMFRQMVIDEFLEFGLREWLEICAAPECGFFAIVDCGRLIDQWRDEDPSVNCAFDVFALFAVIFGIRTIPEECMGDLDFSGGRRLRISYSVSVVTLVRACLTLRIGIPQFLALID